MDLFPFYFSSVIFLKIEHRNDFFPHDHRVRTNEFVLYISSDPLIVLVLVLVLVRWVVNRIDDGNENDWWSLLLSLPVCSVRRGIDRGNDFVGNDNESDGTSRIVNDGGVSGGEGENGLGYGNGYDHTKNCRRGTIPLLPPLPLVFPTMVREGEIERGGGGGLDSRSMAGRGLSGEEWSLRDSCQSTLVNDPL